jgi:hypothetical protein
MIKDEQIKGMANPSRSYVGVQEARLVQEPVAYDKTEINKFVQDLYDKKMQEGKHGHYETMFHVVHQAIKRVSPPAPQRTWVGLTSKELNEIFAVAMTGEHAVNLAADKLKEKNNG